MKLIYVAGPYTAETHTGIENNIRNAENVAIQLWAKGWAVICPHLNTAHFERYEGVANIDYHTWIDGDMEILKRCDAIIMIENWEYSKGSKAERKFCMENNIQVFYANLRIPTPSEKQGQASE
jgi:hypothetical protein